MPPSPHASPYTSDSCCFSPIEPRSRARVARIDGGSEPRAAEIPSSSGSDLGSADSARIQYGSTYDVPVHRGKDEAETWRLR